MCTDKLEWNWIKMTSINNYLLKELTNQVGEEQRNCYTFPGYGHYYLRYDGQINISSIKIF